MRECEVLDLGRLGYAEALGLQRRMVSERKQGRIPDRLLFVEHPHVITIGRNGNPENLLLSRDELDRAGVAVHETDRGGDVTYHGPGQIVGYPILDLAAWKRDVRAYVSALEQVLIDTLAEFGLAASRLEGMRGVWVEGRKIAAIGVHISQWVTSHGFALNHRTDLARFGCIVPCGLKKPVTSMREEGAGAEREEVVAALARHFGLVFEYQVVENAAAVAKEVG